MISSTTASSSSSSPLTEPALERSLDGDLEELLHRIGAVSQRTAEMELKEIYHELILLLKRLSYVQLINEDIGESVFSRIDQLLRFTEHLY